MHVSPPSKHPDMKTTITVDVVGVVNNAHVTVQGEGGLDLEEGRLELALGADRAPAHWDLALLPALCFDPLLVMAGGAIAVPEGDLPAYFRSRIDLFDENERAMAEMVLSGEIERTPEGIGIVGQLLQCETRFEMGEGAASFQVPLQMVLLEGGRNRILMARGTRFSTRRGSDYWAMAAAWLRGVDPIPGGKGQALEVRSLDVDRVSNSGMIMRACIGGMRRDLPPK